MIQVLAYITLVANGVLIIANIRNVIRSQRTLDNLDDLKRQWRLAGYRMGYHDGQGAPHARRANDEQK